VRALLAAALVLGLCGSARAAEELKLPPVTRTTLENGLRTLVVEYHELPLVEFYVIVGAGAAQDPAGKDGLASLTANTLHRGAGTLSAEQFARAVESLGGQIAAAAGTDGTIVSGEFLSGDFAAGLELLRQVLTAPTFASDEVRRARDEQLAGITAALEQPSQVADKCYAAFLFGSHPYGRPVDGRRTTVAKLGQGDVRSFYDRWYHPNDTILVLVGDVGTDDAVARLRSAFGSWKASASALAPRTPPPPAVTARKILLVDKPDATQTQIRFGNISIARNDPDYVPAQVANTILGGGFTSELIEELRIKRSLTYSAYSMFAARLTGGDFRVSTFTKTPTTLDTLDLALAVEGGFRTAPPSPKQLAKARTFLMGQFPLKLETPEALAGRLAEIELNGLPQDELTTYRTRVAGVDAAQVARVSAAHMPAPDAVAVVVVGKAAEIRGPLEAKYGAVQVVSPDACEDMAAVPR
jgi:predicted Zn-dependent peptidase